MPVAINPKAETSYVLAAEREQPKPTRFKLRPLTSAQKLKLMGRHADPRTGETNGITLTIGCAEEGLVGWSDFPDRDGKPTRFRPGDLSALCEADIIEIGGEVWRLSNLTESDEKN